MTGLSLFAFLSGAGVLVAQVTWNRMLLLVAGGSVDSAAAVLCAFMLGLGLGGRFFGLAAQRAANPRRVLVAATLGMALGSLIPLALEPAAVRLYPAFYGLGLQFPARFLCAVIMLFPAAFCAGGIIPALSRLVQGPRGTSEASRLYGVNSIGSALGGFLAGFVLLEAVGTAVTLTVGAALSVLGLTALRGGGGSEYSEPEARRSPGAFHLAVYGAGGCLALGYETVWNRQLTFVLGNSTYAFSTMGIIVLAGIGLGGLLGRRLAARAGNPLVLFGVLQVLLAVSSVLPLSALGGFGAVAAVVGTGSWVARTAGGFLASLLYMVPSTFLMGVTFPAMLRVCAREDRLGEDTGLLILANCLGAAVGPVITTRFLFMHLGVTMSALVLALGSILTGLVCFLKAGRPRFTLAGLAGAGAAVALVTTSPPPGSSPPKGLDLLHFIEDRTATVSVFGREWDGYRSLRINGVEEVPVDQASLEAFFLLGHLPWGYNPDADCALVVALGGGITSGALLTHPLSELTCVEICPGVLGALPFFREENRTPERDPRFRLIYDDGRNYLLGTDLGFDLVVCDATHPGSSESWLLYTREFYSLVLDRLNPGGVAAQWVPLHQLPPREFHRILATWAGVFPHSAAHLAGGRHVILIGGNSPLSLAVDAMFRDSVAAVQLTSVALGPGERPYLLPVLDRTGMARALSGAPAPNTDDRPHCQFIGRKVTDDPQATISPNVAVLFSFSEQAPDPVRTAQMLYWGGSLPEAYNTLAGSAGRMASRWTSVILTSAAEVLYDAGSRDEAERFARSAVRADPCWPRPTYLLSYMGVEPQETE